MAQNVFFSWQSDVPPSVGKDFLESVLQDVCRDISSAPTLEEPEREELHLDRDTKDVPGQPPIFQVILEKIDKAAVFVGDVTFIGKRDNGKGPTPNPNVLIEHGYALKALGYERVINVMNSAFGKPSETNLPFDLRHAKWPIVYELHESATKSQRLFVRNELSAELRLAIISSLRVAPKGTNGAMDGFQPHQSPNGPAFVRPYEVPIGVKDEPFWSRERDPKPIYMASGPAIWLRIMPQATPPSIFKNSYLRKIVTGDGGSSQIQTLIQRPGGYDFVRAADGMGKYYVDGSTTTDDKVTNVRSLVFVFNTGEVWATDTLALQFPGKVIPYLEPHLVRTFVSYIELLRSTGLKGPYKWSIGLTGVSGWRLQMPPPPPGKGYVSDVGDVCLENTIEYWGEYDADKNEIATTLRPFFEKVFDACGMNRPEHLN